MWAVLRRHTLEIYTETISRGLPVGCIKKTDLGSLHRETIIPLIIVCMWAVVRRQTLETYTEIIIRGLLMGCIKKIDGPRNLHRDYC